MFPRKIIQALLWRHNETETLHCSVVRRVDDACPCHRTGYKLGCWRVYVVLFCIQKHDIHAPAAQRYIRREENEAREKQRSEKKKTYVQKKQTPVTYCNRINYRLSLKRLSRFFGYYKKKKQLGHFRFPPKFQKARFRLISARKKKKKKLWLTPKTFPANSAQIPKNRLSLTWKKACSVGDRLNRRSS